MATVTEQRQQTSELAPATKDRVVYYYGGNTEASYRTINKDAAAKGDFTSIPTIDISNIDSTDLSDRKAIASQIYEACTTSGFFYISGHSITEAQQKSVFEAMKRFFAAPLEAKEETHAFKTVSMRGYEPLPPPDSGRDMKEAFSFGDCMIDPEQNYQRQVPSNIKPQNIWPTIPDFRQDMYAYHDQILPLAMKLVRLFALAFGLEETAFDKDFQFPMWSIRALHYPATTENCVVNCGPEHARLGAHSDFTWFTLLLQDEVAGLEVLNKEGVWIEAPPKPGTMVVNVGQYLERQSNSKFIATVHRVRNKTGAERYSLPFFFSQDPGANIDVLETCLEDGEDKKPELSYNVGDLYVRRILPVRRMHPTSIRYRDLPQEELKYDMLRT
ncbi:hypothetical protein AC578_1348 [Pseudocercospora eumusae]|uniref:Fe2OG dioxygenase domain-containing protein n=1 Tax=Pseudocercospora eumusae TaxID=321146 RepID=A0A139HUA3_9PEZI|nr:hypothetical protein AC578_1348 [Pseudocercospora eumusae]